MELMTKELRKKIPALGAQEEVEEPMAYVKFFTPYSNWTWYAMEFDGEDTFYGYVIGLEKEYGYFTLSELKSVKGPMGVPGIERDRYFEPTKISEIVNRGY